MKRGGMKFQTRILDELDLHGIGATCMPAVNVKAELRTRSAKDGFTFDESTECDDRLTITGDDIKLLLARLRKLRRLEKAAEKSRGRIIAAVMRRRRKVRP